MSLLKPKVSTGLGTQPQGYFRCDQTDGVTAPDLSKECSYAEHIVRARGKRTQLTSVSLDRSKIEIFGPALYELLRSAVEVDNHELVEHAVLMKYLRSAAESGQKAERARALQAQVYARRRLEGLVKWSFVTAGVERKDLINWAHRSVQKYFRRM